MCGIGGIIRMSDRPIEASQVKALLLGLESRGRDAAGVVLCNAGDNSIHIYKSAGSASYFVASKGYNDFLAEKLLPRTKIVLVHTRAFTTGQPSVNANNHPLTTGKSVVVHNGVIWNHKELFTSLALERGAETDSDILRAIIDNKGISRKGVEALTKVSGSVAAAIVHPEKPNSLLLLRSGNPIEMAGSVKDPNSFHHIAFASYAKTARAALWRWRRISGKWCVFKDSEIATLPFAADTAEFWGPEGLLWHQKFQTAPYTSNPNWDRFDRFYGGCDDREGCDRSGSTATATKTDHEYDHYLLCPKCHVRCFVEPEDHDIPKSELRCTVCHASLDKATEIMTLRSNKRR